MLRLVSKAFMKSRRNFILQSSLGLLSLRTAKIPLLTNESKDFNGAIVNEEEGEAVQMRDGTAIVKIKISKADGANSISFLSESFRPGDELPVHKHMNEDELIFIHKGTGLFTLGEKKYQVTEGGVILVPKGIWHGLKNNGTQNIEMRMGYTPSGFEGFFREVGTPLGQTFVRKTLEERKAIALKWGMIYKYI